MHRSYPVVPAAVVGLLVACATGCPEGGPSGSSPCEPNPCLAPHQSVCTVVGTAFDCSCNPGYVADDDGACVLEPCEPACPARQHCERQLCVDDVCDPPCWSGETCHFDNVCRCGAGPACPARSVCREGACVSPDYFLVVNPISPELEIRTDVAVDDHTGLMWAREQRGEALVDGRGEFQPEDHAHPQAAVALAAAYCDGLVLAGYDDWRLPNRLELHSLADHGHCGTDGGGPALDQEAFPTATLGTFRTPYWTSTRHFAENQYAVGFLLGEISYDGDIGGQLVFARCVRSLRERTPPAEPFEVRGGVVRDHRTGLEWERQPEVRDVLDWRASPIIQPAIDYCAALTLDGGGFRLPTIKELATIVDETTVQPVIDEAVFPGTQREFYVTSTPLGCSRHLGWYWAVAFGDGVAYPMDQSYTETAYVRCVR
jgi:hypothetical protein